MYYSIHVTEIFSMYIIPGVPFRRQRHPRTILHEVSTDGGVGGDAETTGMLEIENIA